MSVSENNATTYSERGFAQGATITDQYGSEIRAYESSSVRPSIWVNTKGSDVLHDAAQETTLHLSLADATALRDQLTALLDDHFLNDSEVW